MASSKSRGERPELHGQGVRVGVVCGRFNDFVTSRLLDGTLAALEKYGAPEPTVVWVPGAFEIPLAAQRLAAGHDAVVCLGAVIRGDTPHFDYVAGECASGLQRVQLDTGVPVVFGVLTVNTVEQAEERIEKGFESAEVALEMAALLRGL
ncbi:MAG TPA: 6,7-dimethyl-8-ribityllumazine synthase [Acidimicrobiales bacterium]|jgi:6,7-dimethyl-8-ribityllumazine synthase|nr:6,7-dimethyl-8-ribityllumazine synthase [Acidimicrobiales bacterium]